MAEFLEYPLDKFTFRVATDRFYNVEGMWAKAEGNRVTVGVSDFFQQRSGDVAFAEIAEVGTAVAAGQGFATIETIKVDIELPSPISGMVTAVNSALEQEAELINQDPYGAGWLAIIEVRDWTADRANLMTPEAYFEAMKTQAQEEARG